MTTLEATLKNILQSKTPPVQGRPVEPNGNRYPHEEAAAPVDTRHRALSYRATYALIQKSMVSPGTRNRLLLFALVLVLLFMAIALLPVAQVPGGASYYLTLMTVLFTASTVCLLG